MYADKANAAIAEIHDAVVSGKIDLDAPTMLRMQDMLTLMAKRMHSEHKAMGGDPAATARWAAMCENGELALADAIEELRQDVVDWFNAQAKLRQMAREGRLIGARRYELVTEA